MDEPVVTAAAPAPKVRSLAQQEVDFTSEGSPPPGVVGPAQSLAAVDDTSEPASRAPVLPARVPVPDRPGNVPAVHHKHKPAHPHG
jgi:hypothetical protein